MKAKRFVSSLSSHTTTSPSTNTSSGDSMVPQHCTPPLQQSSPFTPQCPPSAPHSPYTKQRAMSMQQSHVLQGQSAFTSGSPRLDTLHLKESMRHVYAQAKHALRQGSSVTSDDGGLGTNSFGSGECLISGQKRMYICHVGLTCIDITIVVGVIVVVGRGGAKILTQGGLISEYGNIQCIICFKISMGGQI
jgi:hypothetical protein